MSHAKALEDPVRVKIIEILYHNQFNAVQILSEMKKTGYNKALTTMRHHLEILKQSGLIQIVRVEEIRGAVSKFYSSSTKILGYDQPIDFDWKYSSEIKTTTTKIEKLLLHLSKKTKRKNTKNKKPLQKNYEQFLSVEIINRAIANVLEKNYKV